MKGQFQTYIQIASALQYQAGLFRNTWMILPEFVREHLDQPIDEGVVRKLLESFIEQSGSVFYGSVREELLEKVVSIAAIEFTL